ncbi:MAG: Alpha N-terminal protein methyltransferase 1 [Stictis urceolatum]|nr:Alpha N-terminal protein methyltransferase 1 [Stictis urceolata]
MTSAAPADAQIDTSTTLAYWDSVPSTVGGMLGGYPQVSRIDLRGSLNFLAKLRKTSAIPSSPSGLLSRGVDCGAGIGRVTAGFLSHVCAVVDIVEPIAKFAAEAQALKPGALGQGKVGSVFTKGLGEWTPGEDGARYNLIWNQWCLGHLTNSELVEYLGRCKGALVEGGWVVVKENVATSREDLYDDEDSSVTRTDESWKALFERAEWRIVRSETQHGFPKELGLYPVKLWALQPRS